MYSTWLFRLAFTPFERANFSCCAICSMARSKTSTGRRRRSE